MNKKSQGLSLDTIIISAIVLIVLVVLWAIFTGRIIPNIPDEDTEIIEFEEIINEACSYYICKLSEEKQTELDKKVCGGYKNNYKAVCKDVPRFETEYEYINLTEKEINQIQTILIEPIKPFYLYGIKNITFKKAKHGFYGGNYNPETQSINLFVYYIIDDILNTETLCHEILHRYGLFNSEVMADIDSKLPCYYFEDD